MAKAKPEPVVEERTLADVCEEIAVAQETLAALYREMPEYIGGLAAEEEPEPDPVEEVVAPAKKGVAAKKAAGKKKVEVTFDDLKEKMTDLLNTKGKEVVKGILSEFGVAKLIEVEEASYADVAEKIAEAMAAGDDAGDDGDDLFGS